MVVEVDVRRMLNGMLEWLMEVSASEGPQSLDHPIRDTLKLAVTKLDEQNKAIDDLRDAVDKITMCSEGSFSNGTNQTIVMDHLVEQLEDACQTLAKWRNVDDARSD